MVARRTTTRMIVFLLLLTLLQGHMGMPTAQAASPSIYWGAIVDGLAPSADNLRSGGPFDTFEARANKRMSILHWGQPWMTSEGTMNDFQTSYFENVRRRGSIPMLNWASWRLGYGGSQPDFQLRDIYERKYDAYLTRWATSARDWGHPFFLRFNHEMNGWWYPWSEGKESDGTNINNNQPGDYVKAWRHVHDIFRSVGASNVSWVWCPNFVGPRSPFDGMYPGDSYVDWTCLDGYNREENSDWLDFNQIFTGSGTGYLKNSYQLILNTAPSKPLMIGEFASREAGDGGTKKAAWIRDALITQIPTRFPKIKAIVWFNWDEGRNLTYPIETTRSSTDAFAAGIALGHYASNQYADLRTSPIPALPSSVSPPAPATLTATADTYIDSANPDSAAGGTSAFMYVNTGPVRKVFLKFDLSTLSGTIATVKLRVKTTSDAYAGSSSAQSIKLVGDVLWKEQYMTYNNCVPISSTALGTIPGNTVRGTWYEVALDPAYVQQKVGGQLSMVIESTGQDGFQITSRESADRPTLIVSFN